VIRPVILLFGIVAPVLTALLFRTHLFAALAILLVSHLLLLYPTLTPLSQWWGRVVTHFETPNREVWLTIDDGPDAAHTRKILDLLDRFSAKATFFVIGERLQRFPQLGRDITERGHTIANHTLTHPSGSFWCLPPSEIARQIDGCAEAIAEAGGRAESYFRTPAGLKNWFVHPALRRRGLTLIGWSARGFDTVETDPAKVASRIAKSARPGSIVLLHEGHRVDSAPEFSLRCIELTLQALAERGYSFVIPAPQQLRP
jgi:peptidoglycan/xylan/chitin deacetylase (PgdA/CDA1 family)